MATDAKLQLQASVTKTATFNGAGVDLSNGTPRRGLKARVIYSAATNASGSNAVTFSIDHSDDNSTFYALSSAASDVINLSTTAAAAEIAIPFETSKRYVRLTATFAGAGSTPTITYGGEIQMARP
jgi:hypothetical protein